MLDVLKHPGLFIGFHLPSSTEGTFSLLLFPSPLSLSSVSSCGMNMQIKFWFLFLILCVALRTNDYQFPLFLFSNFAKQVYSLASQGMCKVRVRLCLKPIQQWKRKVQKSQQGSIAKFLPWKTCREYYASISNERYVFLFSRKWLSANNSQINLRYRSLNCYYSQLTIYRWHGL